MKQEEWKRIEDFPDYEISNQGRIISHKYGRMVLRDPVISKRGYARIQLRHDGMRRFVFVHQLVLKHFGPPQPPNTTPDHINRLRTDNRIENLRWATRQEQMENSVMAKQKGESNGASKLTEQQVIEIRAKLKSGLSLRKIGAEYGVSKTSIGYIKSGKLWDHIK